MESEFFKAATTFLCRSSLLHASELFNTLLRNEQMKRNAHIHCLPVEIRLHILHLILQSKLKVYRNIHLYLDIIGKSELSSARADEGLKRRYTLLHLNAQYLFTIFLKQLRVSESKPGFGIVILAQSDELAEPYAGTNLGRHILAILEEPYELKLLQDIQDMLVCSKRGFSIQIHKCALVRSFRINPFVYDTHTHMNEGQEEYIAIRLSEKIRKIWWVDINPFNSGVYHIE
jgi:hypothetical protein